MNKFIKGFTIAETMLALIIIGTLIAIMIPMALKTKPDENLIKLKKANETLPYAINTLITEDKYYVQGDLGLKPNGEILDGSNTDRDEYCEYFCRTLADVLSTKTVDCKSNCTIGSNGSWTTANVRFDSITGAFPRKKAVTNDTVQAAKTQFDTICKTAAPTIGAEIVTVDGITFFGAQPKTTFGFQVTSGGRKVRIFSPPEVYPANIGDEQGFDINYKVYCVDVDGIPDNATSDDCKNECPFGYGIRADGKVLPGARADEWIAKMPKTKQEE